MIVEFLLQRLSDINQQDKNGWTALHFAAANNNVRLVLALLKRHAKPDIKDESNMVESNLTPKIIGHILINYFFRPL